VPAERSLISILTLAAAEAHRSSHGRWSVEVGAMEPWMVTTLGAMEPWMVSCHLGKDCTRKHAKSLKEITAAEIGAISDVWTADDKAVRDGQAANFKH